MNTKTKQKETGETSRTNSNKNADTIVPGKVDPAITQKIYNLKVQREVKQMLRSGA